LDDQAGSYWAIASTILRAEGVLGPKELIEGIMYNFLKKAKQDIRPENANGEKLNKDGSISKRQPKPNFKRELVERSQRERRTMIERIQNEVTWMNAARRRPDILTKTPTDRCHWDCSFYDMCMLHERGGDDWKQFRDAMYYQEDPYADHRKSAGE
jgi:hypothetical protein